MFVELYILIMRDTSGKVITCMKNNFAASLDKNTNMLAKDLLCIGVIV